jgi:hypothetical protein
MGLTRIRAISDYWAYYTVLMHFFFGSFHSVSANRGFPSLFFQCTHDATAMVDCGRKKPAAGCPAAGHAGGAIRRDRSGD